VKLHFLELPSHASYNLFSKSCEISLSLSLSLSYSYICFWELAGALDITMLANKKELVSCPLGLTFFFLGKLLVLAIYVDL
jgi:hypothetical protein